MLKIGVTGGIGSGKTTVCSLFELLNIPVYYADLMAKKLMVSNDRLIKNIKKLLGSNSYDSNGNLNKSYIADIIFNNKEKLESLNKLVHPAVNIDFEKWAKTQNSPYVLKEAALLFENGSYKNLDYNLLVTAPLELRIFRVIKRDNITREDVLSRVNNQLPDSKKIILADFVINNDGHTSLIHTVIDLHNRFLKQHHA